MPVQAKDVTRPDNAAEALSVALIEDPSSVEVWGIEVFGKIADEMVRCGLPILTPTAASLSRGSRLVAVAMLPGATEYHVSATPTVDPTSVCKMVVGWGPSALLQNQTMLDPQRPVGIPGPKGDAEPAGGGGSPLFVVAAPYVQTAINGSIGLTTDRNVNALVQPDDILWSPGGGLYQQNGGVGATTVFLRKLHIDGDPPATSPIPPSQPFFLVSRDQNGNAPGWPAIIWKGDIVMNGTTEVVQFVPGAVPGSKALIHYTQPKAGASGILSAFMAGSPGSFQFHASSTDAGDTTSTATLLVIR